jgi:hypothetical protein
MLEKKNRLAGEIDIVKVLKGKRINKKDYAVFFYVGRTLGPELLLLFRKKSVSGPSHETILEEN